MGHLQDLSPHSIPPGLTSLSLWCMFWFTWLRYFHNLQWLHLVSFSLCHQHSNGVPRDQLWSLIWCLKFGNQMRIVLDDSKEGETHGIDIHIPMVHQFVIISSQIELRSLEGLCANVAGHHGGTVVFFKEFATVKVSQFCSSWGPIDKDVVGFDISVNYIFAVEIFNSFCSVQHQFEFLTLRHSCCLVSLEIVHQVTMVTEFHEHPNCSFFSFNMEDLCNVLMLEANQLLQICWNFRNFVLVFGEVISLGGNFPAMFVLTSADEPKSPMAQCCPHVHPVLPNMQHDWRCYCHVVHNGLVCSASTQVQCYWSNSRTVIWNVLRLGEQYKRNKQTIVGPNRAFGLEWITSWVPLGKPRVHPSSDMKHPRVPERHKNVAL